MLDLFILIVIVWSLYNGWRNGLVREILATGGLLLGLLGASLAYATFGETLAVATGSKTSVALNIVAFFLLWIIIPLALGFVATLLTRFLRSLHLGMLNAAAGAGVSLLKYAILLSCLLSAMHSLNLLSEERAQQSVLYRPVSGLLSWAIDAALPNADEGTHSSSSSSGSSSSSSSDDAERPDTVWVDVRKK